MLPRLLCEELCSLNPNEDRLSFSVVWKMTSAGEVTQLSGDLLLQLILLLLLLKNEKIRVTLCEYAAGALYVVYCSL